jgi:molybdopterin biosynthesis enzyme
MRPFTSTIPLEEARRRLTAAVREITRTERVSLEHATGRVAASNVRSPIDVPPFARSAMDGYAVAAADTDGASRTSPKRLRIIDRIEGELPGKDDKQHVGRAPKDHQLAVVEAQHPNQSSHRDRTGPRALAAS